MSTLEIVTIRTVGAVMPDNKTERHYDDGKYDDKYHCYTINWVTPSCSQGGCFSFLLSILCRMLQ